MARTVWKYELGPLLNEINTPAGAQFIYATAQHGGVVAYALLDPSETETETHALFVVGTGEDELPDRDVHLRPLGVVILSGGALMFHVFEAE